jgi:hypothetical protein
MEQYPSGAYDDGLGQEDDAAYQAAMSRLAELKQRPIDQLTEDEKKEKLCVFTCRSCDMGELCCYTTAVACPANAR